MEPENLLGHGYFPPELPPAFNTNLLADKYKSVQKGWNTVLAKRSTWTKLKKQEFSDRFWESEWVQFSIPKVGYVRRSMGIPNPYHQSILCETLSTNWVRIESIYSKSTISRSKPKFDPLLTKRLEPDKPFSEFKNDRFTLSFDKLYQVCTDISRYYATIYTHVIAWAIEGKATSKANRGDYSYLGNLIDKNVREGNSGQTFGIPIGPETSWIISELIGCTIDAKLQSKFKGEAVEVLRWIDDIYVYCRTRTKAEQILKYLQTLLTELQLAINEEKTVITRAPYAIEPDWAIELSSFDFSVNERAPLVGQKSGQVSKLRKFSSLAFSHARSKSGDQVLTFATSILENVDLFRESWPVYEAIILKLALIEPKTLQRIVRILVSHRSKVRKTNVRKIVEALIEDHLPRGNHYEVAWSLWLCKEFDIKLKKSLANQIFRSEDVISIMIALDLKEMGLIDSTADVSSLETDLRTESLMGEKWMLIYESITKGWLTPPYPNPINKNEYFKILKSRNISFYDSSARSQPFPIKLPSSVRPLNLAPYIAN